MCSDTRAQTPGRTRIESAGAEQRGGCQGPTQSIPGPWHQDVSPPRPRHTPVYVDTLGYPTRAAPQPLAPELPLGRTTRRHGRPCAQPSAGPLARLLLRVQTALLDRPVAEAPGQRRRCCRAGVPEAEARQDSSSGQLFPAQTHPPLQMGKLRPQSGPLRPRPLSCPCPPLPTLLEVAPAQLRASKTRKWKGRPWYKNGKVGHACAENAEGGVMEEETSLPCPTPATVTAGTAWSLGSQWTPACSQSPGLPAPGLPPSALPGSPPRQPRPSLPSL